jgi:hypothetical protein
LLAQQPGVGPGDFVEPQDIVQAGADVEIAVLALTGAVLAGEKGAPRPLSGEFPARIVDELMLRLAAR